MPPRSRADGLVLGNRSLSRFDVCIVGSGAGGSTAAWILAAAGLDVCVLESGPLTYQHLDDPKREPLALHSNDEIKYGVRGFIDQLAAVEPRTFRQHDGQDARVHGDVNVLPKLVGGAFGHADCAVPRFAPVDFRLKSAVEELIAATPGLAVPGFGADAASARFADWPISYDDLEPYYAEVEAVYGVHGTTGDNPFAPRRSTPYPLPPGKGMYLGHVLSDGARRTSFLGEPLHPHVYPSAIATRPYDGRPACVECGQCAGYGCPSNAKGSPAVTTLRRALLSGHCQLRAEAHVTGLTANGRVVTGVDYVDADGRRQRVEPGVVILAASPVESARLCLLSGDLGNSSGQVGRNLMFHLQTNANGFLPNRVHGHRGHAVSHGLTDFRGIEPGGETLRVFSTPDGPRLYLGGICEFVAPQWQVITEDGYVYATELPPGFGARSGLALKNAMRGAPLGQHLLGIIMQAEDAPQATNRVDLDPTVRDVFGLPVPRITYAIHEFERQARLFYTPFLRRVIENAGAPQSFVNPCEGLTGDPPTSRHVLGTLRMGADPATSVTDADGRFHDLDNLYACDGSVFTTGSGYNPTLTILAVAARIAHRLAGTAPGAA